MAKGPNVGEDDLERALSVLNEIVSSSPQIQAQSYRETSIVSHAESNHTFGVGRKAGKTGLRLWMFFANRSRVRAYEEYDEAGYPMEVLARCYYVTGSFDGLRECVRRTH